MSNLPDDVSDKDVDESAPDQREQRLLEEEAEMDRQAMGSVRMPPAEPHPTSKAGTEFICDTIQEVFQEAVGEVELKGYGAGETPSLQFTVDRLKFVDRGDGCVDMHVEKDGIKLALEWKEKCEALSEDLHEALLKERRHLKALEFIRDTMQDCGCAGVADDAIEDDVVITREPGVQEVNCTGGPLKIETDEEGK